MAPDEPLSVSAALAAQMQPAPERQPLEPEGDEPAEDELPFAGDEELGDEPSADAGDAPPPAAEIDPDIAAIDEAIAANPALGVRIKYAQDLETAGDTAGAQDVWAQVNKMLGVEDEAPPPPPPVKESPLGPDAHKADPAAGVLHLKRLEFENKEAIQKTNAQYRAAINKEHEYAAEYKKCVADEGRESSGAKAWAQLHQVNAEKIDKLETAIQQMTSQNEFMAETIKPNLDIMPFLKPYAGAYAIHAYRGEVDPFADPAVQKQQMTALGYKFGVPVKEQRKIGADAVAGLQKKIGSPLGKRSGAGGSAPKPGDGLPVARAGSAPRPGVSAAQPVRMSRERVAEYMSHGMRGLAPVLNQPRTPVKK